MSGRRPDSIKRRWWEYRHILDNYLSIRHPALFLRVFPEAGKYAKDLSEELVPFVLALLALRTRSRRQGHQAFALDIIYRLLGDPRTADALRQRFHFDYRDFIGLTGQCDVFNAYTVRQMRSRPRGNLGSLWAHLLCRGSGQHHVL